MKKDEPDEKFSIMQKDEYIKHLDDTDKKIIEEENLEKAFCMALKEKGENDRVYCLGSYEGIHTDNRATLSLDHMRPKGG